MSTLIHSGKSLKIEKEITWFVTILLMVVGLPILKNAIVFILTKLYELFIEQGIDR